MHLWVPNSPKNPAPPEYIRYRLCREVYHCTPSQLDREDQDTIMAHWVFWQAEIEVKNLRDKGAAERQRAAMKRAKRKK